MSDNRTIPIRADFQGLFDSGLGAPDLQGLASRFDFIARREDDRIEVATGQHVIKDSEYFSCFIDCVPKHVMRMMRNPPPSDDPILKSPEIDFDSEMVLIVTTHNPNLFVEPEISRIEMDPEAMLVHCRYSDPGPVVQKVISYGKYFAAALKRYDGEIQFVGDVQ